MATQSIPICGEHKTSKQWRPTTFEYSEDGITIRIPNVYAWVCAKDGEVSFTPDIVDELLLTVPELVETAKRARERRSVLTEYMVVVG